MTRAASEQQFIRHLYFRSLPSFAAALMLMLLCPVVTNMMTGHLVGQEGLAVLSLMSPVTMIFNVGGSLLAVGGALQAMHFSGENDAARSNACLWTALKLMIVVALILTAGIIIFINPVLSFLNVPVGIYAPTRRYLMMYAPAAFGSMAIYISFHYLKLKGLQRDGVLVNLFLLLLNAGLNFLLAGVLHMGVAGIGLATTVAHTVASLVGICRLYSKTGGFTKPAKGLELPHIKRLLLAGSPSAMNNLSYFLCIIVFNALVLRVLGQEGLSVVNVNASMRYLAVIIANGTSLSMASLAAIYSSEHDAESLRQVFRCAMQAALLLTTLLTLLLLLCPQFICALFGIDSAHLTAAHLYALRIYGLSLFVYVPVTVLLTFYQSVKRSLMANVFTFLKVFVFAVTFAELLTKISGGRHIWWAYLLAEVTALLLILITARIISRSRENVTPILLMDTSVEKSGRYLACAVLNGDEYVRACCDEVADFCLRHQVMSETAQMVTACFYTTVRYMQQCALRSNRVSIASNVRLFIEDNEVILRLNVPGQIIAPLENEAVSSSTADKRVGNGTLVPDMDEVKKLAKSVHYDRSFGVNHMAIIFEKNK
ncbi:MAG: MATE family efflux transporter [Lachnospiraceae bacterium]|nr:MATE family efflux transporter [Lachnospiraceae bacterium]